MSKAEFLTTTVEVSVDNFIFTVSVKSQNLMDLQNFIMKIKMVK